MRDLTQNEMKAIKPHFDKIAAFYKTLGECTTTQEFKKKMLELIKISDEQPEELEKLWQSMLIELQGKSN